ncbi:hypothetical protein JCM19300_1203 [Algibacter lectus]|uniref:Uncharacterized protein n=1 Tax=Algibacter lectus TaxID=221126 RepID=A0A090VEJ4_9FLAO|nr:hypothetical protein JCM19300_1203 [Algibacter lectus]
MLLVSVFTVDFSVLFLLLQPIRRSVKSDRIRSVLIVIVFNISKIYFKIRF